MLFKKKSYFYIFFKKFFFFLNIFFAYFDVMGSFYDTIRLCSNICFVERIQNSSRKQLEFNQKWLSLISRLYLIEDSGDFWKLCACLQAVVLMGSVLGEQH